MANMKNSFRKFCQGTSMHGYKQLDAAKPVWKVMWVVFLLCAIGVTIYLVVGQIEKYVNQRTATTITVVPRQKVVYPPLKLCYVHFLHWLDWDKGFEMNFTKASLLYGMSFVRNIYSSSWFDVKKAKREFYDGLRRNNLKTLEEFYKAVAKHAPIRQFGNETFHHLYSTTGGRYFNSTEVVTDPDTKFIHLCYVQPGDEIKAIIQQQKENQNVRIVANTLYIAIDDEALHDEMLHVTEQEYNSYMAEWIQTTTTQYWVEESDFVHVKKNYSNFRTPFGFYPLGYSDYQIRMAREIDDYDISIQSSVKKWQNTPNYPCNPDLVSFAYDTSCLKQCLVDNSEDGPSLLRIRLPNYRLEPSKKIIFLDSALKEQSKNIDEDHDTNATSVKLTPQIEELNALVQSSNQKVAEDCSVKCQKGCEQWTYDVTVTINSMYNSMRDLAEKKRTTIAIAYPMDGGIIMMTQVNSQTWENFVGAVGGVIGIFTGASVMAFPQLLYLCFCHDDDELGPGCCGSCDPDHKDKVAPEQYRVRLGSLTRNGKEN